MDQLTEIVKTEVFKYAAEGANAKTFPLSNEDQKVYAVTIVDSPTRELPAGVMVIARVVGDLVIIEEDTTDKPLVDALLQQGIPREKIILAYAGENVPVAG